MLKAYYHNDGINKPHVHIWDEVGQMDITSPFYSKHELRDWIYKTGNFNIHMCRMKGLPA